jgi:hypothetical protein
MSNWSRKSPSGDGAESPPPKADPGTETPAKAAGPRRRALKLTALLAVLALFLGGLLVLGKLAGERLAAGDRYVISFADIECAPSPPGARAEFLDEVQYLAGLPDRVRLLDADLGDRLAEAFARHPRVEKVDRVEVVPPRRVRLHLVFRVPVLAVPLAGRTRAVDRFGTLLPRDTPTEGLPVYAGRAAPPRGPAGTPWGDAAVEAAAREAGDRRPP